MQVFRQSNGNYRPTRRQNAVPVFVVVDGDEVAATLVDISRDGAKLRVPYAVLPGTAVELRVSSTVIPALVQWFEERHAGLRFLDRLEREVLLALEGRGDTDDIFG
ncbi:MAG: PilZ domain-containing protein [Boseongicola sp.]|nr:PilZ domain-containing protein [Boseongicola sp.]